MTEKELREIELRYTASGTMPDDDVRSLIFEVRKCLAVVSMVQGFFGKVGKVGKRKVGKGGP